MGDTGATTFAGTGSTEFINFYQPTRLAENPSPAAPTISTAKTVIIEPLNHGYSVKVGCQTLAIETPEKLTKHLLAYLKNPADVEKKFLAGKYKL